MLRLEDVEAYYGDSHILKGVSFELEAGEVATLLGRNGAGKTTTLRTVMGLVPSRKGRITFNDKDVTGFRPHAMASLGVGYVPEERAVFPSLTVLENLTLPLSSDRGGLWSFDKIYSYFPVLRQRLEHRGSQLSGGEQQMLAIARVLTMDLKLVLLDEPTEGLAPFLVREIGKIVDEIRKAGVTILLVEQNTRFAMQVADRHHVLYNGRIVWQGTTEEFTADGDVQKRYLGV